MKTGWCFRPKKSAARGLMPSMIFTTTPRSGRKGGGGHSGCAKNAEKNSLKKTGDWLLKLLKPLLKKQAGDNDFTRLGSVRYDGDPLDWENFRQPARRKRTISKKSAEQ